MKQIPLKNVLIDTDVLLDLFFNRLPFANDAENILSLCEQKIIIGYITPVMTSNLYYILNRSASHTKVIDTLKGLLNIVNILPMDKDVVSKALHSQFRDFEAALQNYAGEMSGIIEAIITRNVKDYKNSHISVLTPRQFLKIIQTQ